MLSLVALPWCVAADPATTAKPDAEPDYQDELPRIPPVELDKVLETFETRPGFEIRLVAAEPLIRDPVAIAFDERGRMYVAEMPEYNQYANPKFQEKGAVKRLEDTDGDGRFDKSTVFVDGLDSPGAVACYDGGLFVGAVPHILFCKDTDGDGRADLRRPVFTGFARDHAGEAMLNSFRWGFDNRFHLSTSLAGGEVRPASDENAQTVSVRSRGFIFNPRTLTFELTSGGGQHGMSMDDWGRKFVCSNSDPIQMLMYDGRYLARNPYLAAPSAAVSIAPDGKYTDVFRISRVEPWRVLRTRLRSQGIVKGSDEGGKPAGFFTGATGVTIYRGDAWPDEYRGQAFVGEVASNIVFRARLEPDGVGLVARRADPGVEFVASRDNWFRPVQFANGPDGALYVVDMYRELIEGAAFLPPQILKHLDVAAGLKRGRIYRIVPSGFRQPKPIDLGRLSTAELVALLEHRNGWHRDTASRLLYERQDRAAAAPLKRLAVESEFPQGRMTARYALDGLNALDAEMVLAGLNDPHPRVREHALRLAEKFAAESPAIRAKLIAMVDDPDIGVRYQLAFSLGAAPGPSRAAALVRLLQSDGDNRWFRLAAQSSLNEGAGEVFRILAEDEAFRSTKHGAEFLAALAAQIGAAQRTHEIAAVLKSLDGLPAGEKSLAEQILRSLVGKQSGAVRAQLAAAGSGKAGAILANLLKDAQQTAADEERDLKQRIPAIRTLGLAKFDDLQDLFETLLELRQPQPVQAAALETLAKFEDDGVATILLEAWPGLSPELRARAAETLFSREAWIMAFLDAVEQKRVGRGDVDPARITLLQSHPSAKVAERSARLFANNNVARRQDVVTAYGRALMLDGDPAKGKEVFKKNCSACHKLQGVGTEVGADLAAIRNRGMEAVLLNILDPNREVKPQYLSYVVATDDGRTHTGMIADETANSITLRRPDGTSVTILRLEIEALKSTGLSFMPEGLEKEIDVETMADLLAYLNSIE